MSTALGSMQAYRWGAWRASGHDLLRLCPAPLRAIFGLWRQATAMSRASESLQTYCLGAWCASGHSPLRICRGLAEASQP